MVSSTPLTLPPSLQTSLDNLRQLNKQDIQSTWRWTTQDCSIEESLTKHQKWQIAALNDRQHIAWKKGLQVRWLAQTITVPSDFYGYPLSGLTLRLSLTWWAHDAQIYVDGKLVQTGDLFECFTRICLSDRVQPNNTFQIAIRLVSPSHDDGALVRSQLIYELTNQPTPEPSFIADELTVLATLEPASQSNIQAALSRLDWNSLTTTQKDADADDLWTSLSATSVLPPASIHAFQQSLSELRRTLLPFSSQLKQRTIYCTGHAHLDMAWLWPISDTWSAAERTFHSVLNLQKDFPHLTYTHSSPALFEWIEHNRPNLFQQIQSKVKEGTWTIDAGLWIEPELNIISGESIVRQILYGQRYCREKFGAVSKIAWLPDSFGFCWQLPQLLTQGGIETFATLKLSWNDTTEFPHQLFWWQSPDGTRILSLMLPPIGTDIDPIKMSAHAVRWEKNTQSIKSFWLPGLGDHGGGPTRDMLEKSERWKSSPFFPKLSFTTPNNYIKELKEEQHLDASLPIWNSELYLELHRGCYTTHADQKKNNRYCEDLLYQAEAFATIAMVTVQHPYPKAQLDKAWKALLFNQFHDILPGTAIPEVFADADSEWQTVKEIGEAVLEDSLDAIASHIKLPPKPSSEAKPIILFNPLSWPRNSLVEIDLSAIALQENQTEWSIYDNEQHEIISYNKRETIDNKPSHRISFLASDLPALGYRCYWLTPNTLQGQNPDVPTSLSLDNKFITAAINPQTGEIISLVDKSTGREVLSAPANQLQLFRDQSGYWDAWNIEPNYQEHPLQTPQVVSVQWQEFSPLRQSIRVISKTEKSTFRQDYILDSHSPILIIKSFVDWHETHVLLKAHFPLALSSPTATYGTPFGAHARTTHPTTKTEQAQWEVPALRWADLTQIPTNEAKQPYGVSILTQAKHGFDAGDNHLRLTLLKSPIWPDPHSDRGHHHFTYAVYPHKGTWQAAHTVRRAWEFNIPSSSHISQPDTHTTKTLPYSMSFLHIQNSNLCLCALKPSENSLKQIIIRCYETDGRTAQLNIANSLNIHKSKIKRVNLLEETVEEQDVLNIKRWQIATYQT